MCEAQTRNLEIPGSLVSLAPRGRSFGIQAAAAILLWLGALGAIVWRLIHA
jgi:glutathione S-transferase